MLFAGLKKVLIMSSRTPTLLPLSEVLAAGRMLFTLLTVVGAGWLEEVCRWGATRLRTDVGNVARMVLDIRERTSITLCQFCTLIL